MHYDEPRTSVIATEVSSTSFRAICSFAWMELMHKIGIPGGTVAAGHHSGEREVLEQEWNEAEWNILSYLSPRKQKEWMASRELLFTIAGPASRAECLYDDFGKPYLRHSPRHISVSHSGLWCAAMIHDRPCGVDVQSYSPTLRRIAERFLTTADLDWVKHHQHAEGALHVLWGAKECLYKAYGKKKLGFREHIFISAIDWGAQSAVGEIKFEGIHLHYEIHFRLLPEVAWVYCTQHHDRHAYTDTKL